MIYYLLDAHLPHPQIVKDFNLKVLDNFLHKVPQRVATVCRGSSPTEIDINTIIILVCYAKTEVAPGSKLRPSKNTHTVAVKRKKKEKYNK